MTYALDTNIISFMLKRNEHIINSYRHANNEGHIFVIPVVAYYEIRRGLLAVDATVQMQAFMKLCNTFDVVEMSVSSWEKAAEIWAILRKNGTPIGKDDGDIFIAAQCIVGGFTLVTDNIGDFERIDELNFISWSR